MQKDKVDTNEWTVVKNKRNFARMHEKKLQSSPASFKKLRQLTISADRLMAEGVLKHDPQEAGTNTCGVKMVNNATQSPNLVTFEYARACAIAVIEMANEDPNPEAALQVLRDSGPMMDDTGSKRPPGPSARPPAIQAVHSHADMSVIVCVQTFTCSPCSSLVL